MNALRRSILNSKENTKCQLIVPASDFRKLEKISHLKPDVAVLDLEDGVAIGSKELARQNIVKLLAGTDRRCPDVEVAVRLNHINSNGNATWLT